MLLADVSDSFPIKSKWVSELKCFLKNHLLCFLLFPFSDGMRWENHAEGMGAKRKKLSVAMKCLFNFTEKMPHVRNVLQGKAKKNSIWKLLSMAFLHYLNEIFASACSCSLWPSTLMGVDKCLLPEEVPGAVKLNGNRFEQHNWKNS